MAKLTARARAKLPRRAFVFPDGTRAQPGVPKFPIHDLAHARAALARAAQPQVRLTPQERRRVARAVCNRFPDVGSCSRGLGALPRAGRISDADVKVGMRALGRRAKACGITPELLRAGMAVEREHADVTRLAAGKTARIAAAHICESGPGYYPGLKRLERRLEKTARTALSGLPLLLLLALPLIPP